VRTIFPDSAALVAISAAVVLACGSLLSPDDSTRDYEVWVVDQSNSPGVAHGGAIHIYPRTAVASMPAGADKEVIDLSAETTALCQSATGAPPARPHMLFFNSTSTHAVLSFVASGHVVIFNASSRQPVACLRTAAGTGGARQAHAAVPAPDDSYIVVANQNGKRLERIDANFGANTFTLNDAAAIDLAGCTTPSGAPCESALLRPDNAPICPLVDGASRHTFVTLRGGGLFVVDARATPMRIVAEYDSTTVHGNGCGGAEVGASMFINSGGGTTANLTQFDVYRFETAALGVSNAPNRPGPSVVFTDGAGHRDAHGTVITPNERFLWVADRAANVIEVFDARSHQRLAPIQMVGPLSSDPTPDLLDLAPSGDLVFVTLRGPTPLSGDPHVSTGSTPGLGVMEIEDGGRRGTLRSILPISNLDAAGVERADPHGIRVRRR
jgi:DNA-binding beta-propeller fold protein YncE